MRIIPSPPSLPSLVTSVALMLVVVAGSSSAATLIYEEPFDAVGSAKSVSSVGWMINSSASGTVIDNTSVDSAAFPVLFFFASGGGDPTTGYLFHRDTVLTGESAFFWTDGLSLGSASLFDRTEFDLRSSGGVGGEPLQMAIKIDSSWYVTNTDYSPAVDNVWTNNFASTGSTWSALNFTSGSALSVGVTMALPTSGTITGVGVYNLDHTFSSRVDNFQVWVVPEPSSLALLGAAGLALLSRRRRIMGS